MVIDTGSFRVEVVCSFQNTVSSNGFRRIEIPFSDGFCFLDLHGFQRVDQEGWPRSPGSAALYYAQSVEGSIGVLLQYLPPYCVTSCHSHSKKEERFFILAGRARLYTEEFPSGVLLQTGDSSIAYPKAPHQLVTLDSPAIGLLKIQDFGGKNPLGMEDYNRNHVPFVSSLASR